MLKLEQNYDHALSAMLETERTADYSCVDYLGNSRCARSYEDVSRASQTTATLTGQQRNSRITPDDRMKVTDWCYHLIDKCELDRETVAIAMGISDRFMSAEAVSEACHNRPQVPVSGLQQSYQDFLHDRSQYQLMVLTALYIAIKFNERVALSSQDMSRASHDIYSAAEIESMELRILHKLKFRLCAPTFLQFGCRIVDLVLSRLQDETDVLQGCETWMHLQNEVAYQAENAVRIHRFTYQRPSTVAVAAVICAIEQMDDAFYELLMNPLLHILKQYAFDMTPCLLLDTKSQLEHFMKENELA